MSIPHFLMVVDDDDEIEIANQNRGYLQRFDFDSTSTSFTDPLLKYNFYKKDGKSSSLIISIILYLQILYKKIFRFGKWIGETKKKQMNHTG